MAMRSNSLISEACRREGMVFTPLVVETPREQTTMLAEVDRELGLVRAGLCPLAPRL